MNRFVLALVVAVTLSSCGSTIRSPSLQGESATSFVQIETIAIDSDINFAELGYAIFLRVTSTSNAPATGATVRYPEDGVVLALQPNEAHALSPRMQIPIRDDVQIEISVFALPNDITLEGLSILTLALPGVGKLFAAQAPIAPLVGTMLGRVTDATRKALEKGRMVAYHGISALEISHQGGFSTSSMHVTATTLDMTAVPSAILQPLTPQSPIGNEQPFYMFEPVFESDLIGKTAWELDVMRNEIFARHGRGFKRDDLRTYFRSQPWYEEKFSPDDFDVSVLTPIQRQNAEFIIEYQNQHDLRIK